MDNNNAIKAVEVEAKHQEVVYNIGGQDHTFILRMFIERKALSTYRQDEAHGIKKRCDDARALANGRKLVWSNNPFTAGANRAKDSFNMLAKQASSLASMAKRKANQAVRFANDAKNFAVEQANKAAKAVSTATKWVEGIVDKIKKSIPKKFSIIATSIADVAKTDLAVMGCVDRDTRQRITGLDDCEKSKKTNRIPMEATVCASEETCKDPGANCFTPDQDECDDDTYFGDEVDGIAYAKPCPCQSLKGGRFHCNYASGFCQQGATPFAPPLNECSMAGGLVYGSDGYNRLCYISPLWKCAGASDTNQCRTTIGSRYDLQGPSLCRTFCDPTFENRNNHLAQYIFSDGARKCVCEVGIDRVFPDAIKTSSAQNVHVTTPFSSVLLSVKPVTGRRKMLGLIDDAPFTRCETATDCTPTFEDTTLCRSLWGEPIPCYSCSERVHGSDVGYQCDPVNHECECTVNRDLNEGDTPLVDIGEWRGNGWCDKIMRGYKTSAIRSPLERAWIHRCTVLRALASTITNFVGLPTVPLDFLYNPGRLLSIAQDATEGVGVYYLENYDDDSFDDRAAFFDRLVELHIDPLVTMTVLDFGNRIYSAIGVIISNVDPIGTVRALLDPMDDDTKALFEEGVSKTGPVLEQLVRVVKETDVKAVIVSATSTMSTVYNLTRSALANATRIEMRPRNNSIVAPYDIEFFSNITDDDDEGVDPLLHSRQLLSLEKDCLVIANMKDRVLAIGDFLSEYYGNGDGYLKATLCSYEFILQNGLQLNNPTTCANVKGQSDGQHVDIGDGFPSFKVNFTSFSIKKTKQFVEDFIQSDDEKITADISAFADRLSGAAVSCDADTLLCKNRQRSLPASAWIVEGWAIIAFIFFKLIGVNSFGVGVFITIQFSVLTPMILYLTYGFPVTCLPRLPVCVADDFFDLLLTIFPRHIMWPSRVVSDVHRSAPPGGFLPWMLQLDKETSIKDCKEYGFKTMFDAYFWLREYLDVQWSVVIDWPLVTILPEARRASNVWKNTELTPLVNQCGYLNAQGVIPSLLTSFFLYVTLSFILVPGIRISVRSFFQALPLLKKSVLALLDIYNY
jgi:hypothetical protein